MTKQYWMKFMSIVGYSEQTFNHQIIEF